MKNQILGFLLATASMLYELILAQILNLSLGGTIFQYTITIGIYAASLGLGSLYYQLHNQTIFKEKKKSLLLIELFLALIGVLSLFGVYILQYLFFKYELPLIGFQFLVYGLIFIIGLLSGLELPLLMDIDNDRSNSFASGILFVDYLGTLMGCILFPLICIPYLNLIQTLFCTALINLFVAAFFTKELRYQILIMAFGLLLIAGLFRGNELSTWLSLNFIS